MVGTTKSTEPNLRKNSMPLQPDDPDYKEVMARHREKASERPKIRSVVYTPPGYSQIDPDYEARLEQEKLRRRRKKQKEKEQKQ